MGRDETRSLSDLSNPLLGKVSHRKESSGQLFLIELEQVVGLILAGIGTLVEGVAPIRRVLDSGIVARGHLLNTDLLCKHQQPIKLQEGVTASAGQRRSPTQVIPDKGLDHPPLEFLFQIQDIEAQSQLLGNSTGVVDIIQRAAAAKLVAAVGLRVASIIPQLHRAADHLKAGLFEENGCRGTVDTPTHRQQHGLTGCAGSGLCQVHTTPLGKVSTCADPIGTM